MDPRLYRCVSKGDVWSLRGLLDESPSLILMLTPQQNSIIHIACRFGHASVVQEVCRRCQSLLMKPNVDGDTPLHVAARAGRLGVVRFLLAQIIDEPTFDIESGGGCRLEMVRMGNKKKNTALHEAIGNGHLKVADLLIEFDPQLVHHENHKGESPLYLAARGGAEEIVNTILMFPSAAKGGWDGQTALHAAVIENHPVIVQSLLRARPELIHVKDHDGRNALYYASSSGYHEMVKGLLKFDFSAAYAMDRNGHSPLHAAALSGRTKVIKEILQHCPDSGELLDLNGQNALHLAVLSGKTEVISSMLEMVELEGLVNQPDKNGNTPLHLAATERSTWIMRHLLRDERINQRARNISGLTALDIIKPTGDPATITAPISWRQPYDTDRAHHWHSLKNADLVLNQEAEDATDQSYKQRGQTLLMVATLLTAITFAAAFTMPGGYNNNLGPDQGVALLQSSKYFRRFLISDVIAMTSSITAACVILWGAVASKKLYVHYYSCAMVLTYISLQLTALAFTNGILAVLPDQAHFHIGSVVMGIVFHISTCLFLFRLAQIFSILEVCMFLVSRIRKLSRTVRARS